MLILGEDEVMPRNMGIHRDGCRKTGTVRSDYWAEGYEGKVRHEYHQDDRCMYFHHCCRHVGCGQVLDSRLVVSKELDYCYRCGEELR